ncbi:MULTISPECIES: hypothetical protein [Arthrobacter]|uniref:Uncharacterized protein n=1 Tax=Arthrobacter bambusae TaxID=1338426 RepID=A0AAW8DKZ3_9MICC|nr:hypothetical protein [Arthrobacter bambusae]MDP9906610.1 hypothetical protein [Arthrobacter bambusae]MDQ0130855.1 hypothetical protein [Arthrobacter bambusae]MDQ0182288.1 hypothetical protein [Arthrobacter bambusae]
MGVVRSSLTELLGILSDAVSPVRVRFDDGSEPPIGQSPDAPVTVHAVAMNRVGRSRREGPLLDLELKVAVECHGPMQLDNMEKLLVAIEQNTQYSVVSSGEFQPDEYDAGIRQGLGFLVRVPIGISLDEPSEQPAAEPRLAATTVARLIHGRLVDIHNKGIPEAYIRPHSSAAAVVSDPTGHFEVLASADDLQHFVVAVRGTEREVSANTSSLPVIIRWE